MNHHLKIQLLNFGVSLVLMVKLLELLFFSLQVF